MSYRRICITQRAFPPERPGGVFLGLDALAGEAEAVAVKAALPGGKLVVEAEFTAEQLARADARNRDPQHPLRIVPALSAPASALPQELQDAHAALIAGRSAAERAALTIAPGDDILVALRKLRAALGIAPGDWPIDKRD